MIFLDVPYYDCFENVHKIANIEKEVLISIAKIESNFNNAAKNTNFNGSIDYGIMQINSFWLKHFQKKGYTKSFILSPCGNIYAAAYILNYCFAKKKNFSLAIECYNKGEKIKETGSYFKKFKKYYVYYKNLKFYGTIQTF